MFLANYGDGLSDLDLPVMVDEFRKSNAVGSLLLVQPTASFDIVGLSPEGKVGQISPLSQSDIWINGGFFVFRNEIFRYINPGDELVRQPFQRLIEKGALLAHKCTGFWQCMDTFKDKQCLEELNQGNAPWKVWNHTSAAVSNESAKDTRLAHDPLKLDGGANRRAPDSVPGLSFRRYRDRLRWHNPKASGGASGLRVPLGRVQRNRGPRGGGASTRPFSSSIRRA